jgi:endoglucanase Acf2
MKMTPRLMAVLLGVAGIAMALPTMRATAQPVQLGAGAYVLSPKGPDKRMPPAPNRTDEMLKQAAQTSQWYSTLIFAAKPEALFVQPITVKTTPAGLEFALPSKEVVPTWRRDVEIRYPHKDPLVISPVAFEPGTAKLAKADDWSIDISMARGADDMRVTVARGNPFASIQISRGDARVRLPSAGERLNAAGDPRVLALKVGGKAYALFAPSGATWESASATEWIARLPAGKGYLSAAALPDDKAETLALFTRHAYAFIQQTRVEWRYDEAASTVETTFKATTKAMEGSDNGPLLGLYPHHWFKNTSVEGKLGPEFDTVRGKLRLLAAPQFKTTYTYNGFVPYWPAVQDSPRLQELKDLMANDLRDARREMLQVGRSAYWQGLGLQRTMKLADVFEQQGDLAGRDRLLAMAKKRAEEWLDGRDRDHYVHYDSTLGSVAIYPDEFSAVSEINDKHFWYGYWIRVAAEIGLRDPAWIAKDKWGGMIELLVADIATTERGKAEAPFLRNYDAYEGHTWANGIGLGEFGNNNESSSEAINAWSALILWGEVTGNKALRDLGIFLRTSEIQAINHYWFDIHGLVFAPEYKNVDVSLVFGGQYMHNTWWTDEPRQITGINLLPITTAHLYLGTDPKFIRKNLDALAVEMESYAKHGKKPRNPPPKDIWQDIFAKYQALADPALGLKIWDRWGSVNAGDSRTHALHFMLSLEAMGTPDFSVTANTPLYSVFKRADGSKTYLAFNPTNTAIAVRFSDGKTLTAEPGKLTQAR